MNFPRDRSIVDWPPRRPRQRRIRLIIIATLGILLFSGGTALSYYVNALWFDSLGYIDVFWKTLKVRVTVFGLFAGLTFAALYGAFLAFKPARLNDITGGTILINGQPLQLPVEPVLRLMALGAALVVALATGARITADWNTLVLSWYGPGAAAAPPGMSPLVDPIFGVTLPFYLFTLPAWHLVIGWLTTLAVIVCGIAIFFIVVTGGTRMLSRGRATPGTAAWRGLSISFGVLLLTVAARVYLGRFDRLFVDRVLFSGVSYTDAHVTLTGSLVIAFALAAGAAMAFVNAVTAPRLMWLAAAVVPAGVSTIVVAAISSYVGSFVVKPNELARERPFIGHNIEMTRQAFGLNRIESRPFPAEGGVEGIDAANNQSTIQNIRLWDWRALQDTLRQIQEIRTYYEFPDIDIDRYVVDGSLRQMMLATRELSIEKLPESSRNWINEKLIYTHGYGITMTPVNGFTPEGMPALVLSDMPVRSTVPGIKVTRPEIYFGELTNHDVYVRTRQQEFNYPQGETNSVTSYEATGGIVIGGFFRRLLIALDRGDVGKLPFSDDVTAESRLLMRRNVRERVAHLAPFLTFDPDPYIVVGDDGRLSWIIDAFTTSDRYPYSRHYRVGRSSINYIRNSVKAVVDAYDGTTTFYVFDRDDPIVAAYRAVFPSLFKDADAMKADLRRHVRYPELLLELQAMVYGLYHMTSPDVFYNREDLWSVASEVRLNERREQSTQPIDPNFVLMTLPGEKLVEFVEILPFTPANRNNLIGWIAARSDEPHYGKLAAYEFPKTRLVDGPLQVEARIDQNPQLSSQLTLWNQQGSHVRRGSLLVMPVGRALLYAEAVYLQAERSPMPELRIVVLAVQDRLAYGPTFDAALAALFGNAASTLTAHAGGGGSPGAPAASPERGSATAAQSDRAAETGAATGETDALISEGARNLADYQRLTAEGKLGEAGQKLEQLKRTLEELQRRQR
jgi:uncharacterized protein